jgi:hypothetical protein
MGSEFEAFSSVCMTLPFALAGFFEGLAMRLRVRFGLRG